MEVGLMEIVRSVNRSWIDDAYLNLYRLIHPGKKSGGCVRGKLSGYQKNLIGMQESNHSPSIKNIRTADFS